MDVTCQRCGTEYEFDETLVSERGTTVKCTHCGHLFKVYRPGSRPTSDAAEKKWQVRGADGQVETLRSLRDLQERIANGRLKFNDQISRSGDSWKPLGEIAELHSFFEAAKASAKARTSVVDSRERISTALGVGGEGGPADPRASTLEGIRPPTDSQDSMDDLPTTVPENEPRRGPPKPASRSAKEKVKRRAPVLDGESPREPAADRRAPALSQPEIPIPSEDRRAPRLEDAAPDAAHQPVSERPASAEVSAVSIASLTRARVPWVRYLLLLGVLAGAAYVGFNWRVLSSELLESTDAAAEALSEADAALYLGHSAGYEDAIGRYDRISRQWPTDPRGYVGLSRAHARLAAASITPSDSSAVTSADGGQSDVAPPPESREARQAMRYAEQARELAPEDVSAKVAAADALRLLGRDEEAAEILSALGDAEPSADVHRLRGLMTQGEEAIGEFRSAIALSPTDVGVRLLMTRSLIEAGSLAAAGEQLDAITDMNADHPALAALRETVAQSSPDAGMADAAVVAEVEREDVSQPERPPPDEASPRAEEDRGGEGVPAGRDYSWYISRGEELQERGSTGAARAHFERALSLRPGSSEALTGMGYLALSAGDYAGAARRFEPATRAGYASAYIGLGRAYRGMGRLQEALRAYERYLERRSSGGEAAIARRQVEALREQLGRGSADGPAPTEVPVEGPAEPEAPPAPEPDIEEPASAAPEEAPVEPPEPPEPGPNELPSSPPPPPVSSPDPPPAAPPGEGPP